MDHGISSHGPSIEGKHTFRFGAFILTFSNHSLCKCPEKHKGKMIEGRKETVLQ
jgi:hypothetical protein